MELIEPGLTDQTIGQTYKDYQLNFRVVPYPEAGRKTTPEEYRLRLTVNKVK
ncbi:hypothetical protein ACFLYX_03600 [Chloroflexota bacterium]